MPTLEVTCTRVFLIEAQSVFARALSHVLSAEPGLQIVGMAKSVEQANFGSSPPNLLLIDIDDHPGEVETTIATCRRLLPQVRICTLSASSQPDIMHRCLAAGAEGYIFKDTSLSELIAAIKSVADGSSYVDPRVAGHVLRRRALNQRPDLNELSPRETDILRLIAQGLSNKEIGDRLLLSEKTVKNHISRIFTKLNITARTQAAVHAIRVGIA
ncbi:MAG: LuxR C-terminal-related transcriptional regulator [Vulcanimicrobiaceae bacterium]